MQQRAIETRETILQAAAQLMTNRTFKETTVLHIIEETSTSQGAFYFHFPSKEALAEALIARAAQRSTEIATATICTPALLSLVRFTQHLAHSLATEPVMRASLRLNYEGIGDPRRAWIQHCRTLLSQGRQEQGSRGRVDVEFVATMSISAITSDAMLTIPVDKIPANVHNFWNLIFPGIGLSPVKAVRGAA